MARRLALVLLFTLLVTGSAWGQGVGDRKRAIDDKISRLQDKIAQANRREGVLTSEISAVTAKIRTLQDDVASSTTRLNELQSELAVYEERLAKLEELYEAQTRQLNLFREQHEIATRRLEERLIAIYQADDPSTVDVVLAASTFSELLDQLDYVQQLGDLDRRIAGKVAAAKGAVRRARSRTDRSRRQVAETARAIRVRAQEQRAETSRLIASREALAGARATKQRTLAVVHATEREYLHEVEGLARASAALAARIQASQSTTTAATAAVGSSSARSASGFIWPVSGTLTSGFGWRWGRRHEGIDISAPSGTPIAAAANGTVIYSGWMGGYGNLVVVDHGGGIATAYAHMSSIGAANGQVVGQGATIGYVGCTGHCYGSHLHFEVRVNGAAVDPLAYL